MAYTELTCEDEDLSLEDLYEGSLRKMPDGSFSQQVVIVVMIPDHIAQYQFILGTVDDITATVGDNLVPYDTGSQWSSMSAGTVTNTNAGAAYPTTWTGVTKITINGFSANSISGYPAVLAIAEGGGHQAAIYPSGKVVLQYDAGYWDLCDAGTIAAGVAVDLVLTFPSPVSVVEFNGVVGSFGELTVDGEPDPPSGDIAPEDMTVVYNSDETGSNTMASDYATAYGIPGGNVIGVSLGTSDACDGTQAAALYAAINTAGRQITQLCFSKPSRTTAGQSITSVATFGVRVTTDLTVSELYNTSSLKPYTDHGRRPAAILLSSAYRRDTTVLNSGTSYLFLAKDGSGGDNKRGNARASQTAAGLSTYDARGVAGIPEGASPCNQLSTSCGVGGYPTWGDVAAAYESIYLLSSSGSVPWLEGFYGDNVTSYGGLLPDGNGGEQTPLTYFLDLGASMSCGTVAEPYQDSGGNSPGSLVEQFVDVSIFDPLFRANVPVGIAAWAAVKCPDRTLFAGDLMFQAQFP